MKITVNARELDVVEGTSIASLLSQLGKPDRHVAVERNGEIVEASDFATALIESKDRLEIVHFVGGG
jgi:sulfur carrier protein